MGVAIQGVQPGSPADKAGIRPGMVLLALDGHEITDGLDYEFYSPPARLAVKLQEGGRVFETTVRKQEYQPLGCTFGTYLIDAQHSCRNNCVFCFIDQLPQGMRAPLYFKDDDERLGFLFGNYVTLTNLTKREIQRIIDMRIAPVNISVHTANPTLRAAMMGNPAAGEALRFIPLLAEAGIPMNCQLVLCPGLNDGEELCRSIEWLAGFAPAVQSIAAVPVGLTRHRAGLAALRPYTPAAAAEQLDIMLRYGDDFAERTGHRLVYPADEWFLLAGRPIPPEGFYDDYPQLENGVGMWRLFQDDFLAALADAQPPGGPPPTADIATGVLAAPLLEELAGALARRWPGAALHVHPVENRFFGPGVTVAGLVTGGDLTAALGGRLRTHRLLMPDAMLRAEGDLMLDGVAPADIQAALGVEVQVVRAEGAALVAAFLG